MSDGSSQENPNIVAAMEISRKFEFYLVALVFTVLALSIQTAAFSIINIQCIMEIAGWFSLALSGLAGLSRLEWLPVAYNHMGSLQKEEKYLNAFNQGIQGRAVIKEDNTLWSMQELRDAKGDIELHIYERNEIIAKLDTSIKITYNIHKWFFVFGIFCILFSRTLSSLTKIMK